MKRNAMKKNRTKKMLAMLLAVCLTVALLPIAAFAADTDLDGYDDDDVKAIQEIIKGSPALSDQFDADAPGTWEAKDLWCGILILIRQRELFRYLC